MIYQDFIKYRVFTKFQVFTKYQVFVHFFWLFTTSNPIHTFYYQNRSYHSGWPELVDTSAFSRSPSALYSHSTACPLSNTADRFHGKIFRHLISQTSAFLRTCRPDLFYRSFCLQEFQRETRLLLLLLLFSLKKTSTHNLWLPCTSRRNLLLLSL